MEEAEICAVIKFYVLKGKSAKNIKSKLDRVLGDSAPSLDTVHNLVVDYAWVPSDNGLTILDYLNEDCWRAVLKYVPIRNVIRSASTSREWQRVMFRYLSSIQIGVHIEGVYNFIRKDMNDHNLVKISKYADFPSIENWSRQLGHTVVALYKAGNVIEDSIIINNFRKLQVLKLNDVRLQEKESPATDAYFPHLRQFYLEPKGKHWIGSPTATDDSITPYITSDKLEVLEIRNNTDMTGLCLTNIRSTRLKALVLRCCTNLELQPFVSITDRLEGLTKLVLNRSRRMKYDQVHLLLGETPNLKYLAVRMNDNDYLIEEKVNSNDFYKAVCGLVHLEHLSTNFGVWDQHLEEVTRCCRKLKTLKLLCSRSVTERGREAVYRNIGENLECLDLAYGYSGLDNTEYVAGIRACPKLTCLRVDAFVAKHEILLLAEARRNMRHNGRLKVVSEFSELDDPCSDDEQCDHELIKDVIKMEWNAFEGYDSDNVTESVSIRYAYD